MQAKGIKRIATLGCICMLLIQLSLVWSAFFRKEDGYLPHGSELFFAFVLLALLAMIHWVTGRFKNFSIQGFYYLVASACACFFVIQLLLSAGLRYRLIWDMLAVHQGGANWALYGNITAESAETFDAATYFYWFPNNLGAAAFWSVLFKGSLKLGVTDLFKTATFVNSVLCTASLGLTALCARHLGGIRCGITALACFLLYVPMWFAAPVFYTDFLTILFPIFGLWLFLIAQEKKSLLIKAALYTACSVVIGLGGLLKGTVWIVFIALLLCLLLQKRFKELACLALAALLSVAGWLFLLDRAVYPAQLDKETAKAMNTPLLHWVMMGLQGDGSYDPSAYELTRSYTDPRQRDAALKQEISRRIQILGLEGLLRLAGRKWERCYSDGTLGVADVLSTEPEQPQGLPALFLKGTPAYDKVKHFCNGLLLAQLLLSIAASIKLCKKPAPLQMLPVLCTVGLALFLLLWETNGRYITNFMPLLFVCAALGLCYNNRQKAEK